MKPHEKNTCCGAKKARRPLTDNQHAACAVALILASIWGFALFASFFPLNTPFCDAALSTAFLGALTGFAYLIFSTVGR